MITLGVLYLTNLLDSILPQLAALSLCVSDYSGCPFHDGKAKLMQAIVLCFATCCFLCGVWWAFVFFYTGALLFQSCGLLYSDLHADNLVFSTSCLYNDHLIFTTSGNRLSKLHVCIYVLNPCGGLWSSLPMPINLGSKHSQWVQEP